ncbi:MAG: hypothetical protein J6U59_06265 [Alistipes sp.]|nr:hypothetical protein [Alistipes sp.]
MLCRVKYALFVVVALLVGVSCQRPDEGNLDITLTVRCVANVSEPECFTDVKIEPGEVSYVVRAQNTMPLGSRFEEDVCLRYVVDLYEVTSSKSVFVERQVFFVEDQKDDADGILDMVEATFNVNPTKYKVLFWCDYVQGSAKNADLETWFTNGWYYNTEDLRKITYSDSVEHVTNNDDKQAFTTVAEIDLTSYSDKSQMYALTLPDDSTIADNVENSNDGLYYRLDRPMGRFKCITEDADDFLKNGKSEQDITAIVTYAQYVSAGYNVEEQKPNYSVPTRKFIAKPTIDEDGNFVLFSDWVFVSAMQTNVMINIEFYDGDYVINSDGTIQGEKISHFTGIVVPLKRNMETIIKGHLLKTIYTPCPEE